MKYFLLLAIFFNSLFSLDINYQYAIKLMKQKEYKKAYNLFLDDVKNGNAKSQVMIGRFFLQGNKLVEKDYKKAMYYFELASKQKNIEANCYLAYMYANGKNSLANFGRAHVFAKEGKKQGNKLCIKVWKDFNLDNYPEDKSWKLGYYKPID